MACVYGTIFKYSYTRLSERVSICNGGLSAILKDPLRSRYSVRGFCFSREIDMGVTTHGLTKTLIYSVWKNMKRRCLVPTPKDYARYGGRGITICPEWLTFSNFYADMGNLPFLKAQIERVNNDGNYEKSNCEWKTGSENARNTRQNVNWTYDGKTMCMKAWAEHLGIAYYVLRHRVNARGWSIEQALSTPLIPRSMNRTWKDLPDTTTFPPP